MSAVVRPGPAGVETRPAAVDPGPAAGSPGDRSGARPGTFAGPAWDLRTYDPLVTTLGPLPVVVFVFTTRDLLTPALIAAAALAVVLVMVRPPGRVLAALLLGLPLLAVVMTVSFGVLTDPHTVDGTTLVASVGPFELWSGALVTGLATSLRTVALLLLVLVGGLSTTGADVVRAMVQQLRVPYRIGYAALAALRFVPRFGHELEVIRSAHRVRGVDHGRGPLAGLRRQAGYAVPLLAGGIRHGERVSLAMEARGFGAHPARTERVRIPFRARDVVFLVATYAVPATIVLVVVPALARSAG
ncbi:energy-coupling factor transporter transmembrane component T [Cellulosimicrobium arenosum]|uniref:Energy-coupling factor transporter transmembrane protein EcfT n=1 Tax=Cellulosimicrobium arenosum TaxID=2708133 RepID=A0A927PDE4_9MICO|nr:energy-coupling factor transporter transmembrane component T [Cellulosimicrobium arenosum]MBD8079696.1 energy-coupling factor transporter transmembrane protein EcfT [Cellulosimicrobium arenosum]